MITNLDQLIAHNKKFTDAFVDLKLVGWKSYSKAVNDYTFNFFKKQMTELDTAVETFGKSLKNSHN